jgi:NAD(P)-dependent dehydrogenase (short-subunit alcohol dehydrogenase family)
MLFMGEEFLEFKPWRNNQDLAGFAIDWDGLDGPAPNPMMVDFHQFMTDLLWLRRRHPGPFWHAVTGGVSKTRSLAHPKPHLVFMRRSRPDLQLTERGQTHGDRTGCGYTGDLPMTDNPATAHPQPPQHEQQQSPPGETGVMMPAPDHGEESYRGSGRLAGKSALITGADSGIGRAVAIAFAREGADVVISYLEEHDDARETAKWVEKAGRRAVLIHGDVSREDHCQTLVNRTVDELGRIDILVNNAAMQRTHESIEEISSDEWDQTFRTNIYSMFYLCKEAIPRMAAGSAIVNTASINSKSPSPNLLAYATTKGAIANFTAGLAQMVAKQGIRVNCVAPGPISTPLIPSTMPEKAVKSFGQNTPLGRAAAAAAWAARPAAISATSAGSSARWTSFMSSVDICLYHPRIL